MIPRREDTIDDACGLDAAEEMDGVMNRMPLLSQGSTPISGCDPRATRQLGPLVMVEDPARPTSAELVTECSVVPVDQAAVDMGALHNAVISHIYRAALVIRTRCEGAGPALVDELGHITDEMDAAIHLLQVAAHDRQLHRGAGVDAPAQSAQESRQ